MKNNEIPTEACGHIYKAILAVVDDLTAVPELLQNRSFRELCEDLALAASSAGHLVQTIGDSETASDIVKASNKLCELAKL